MYFLTLKQQFKQQYNSNQKIAPEQDQVISIEIKTKLIGVNNLQLNSQNLLI